MKESETLITQQDDEIDQSSPRSSGSNSETRRGKEKAMSPMNAYVKSIVEQNIQDNSKMHNSRPRTNSDCSPATHNTDGEEITRSD